MAQPPPSRPSQGSVHHESNLAWGPIGIATSIVISVIATMKQDLRGLFLVAWPVFVFGIWRLCKSIKRQLPRRLITCSVSAIAAMGLYLLSAWLRPSTKEQQPKAYTDPATFVEFAYAYPSGGFPVFKVDKQVALNVFILNQGPSLAHDVRWDAFVSLLQTPVIASMEKELYEQFREHSRNTVPVELGPTDGKWQTFYTRTISERDVMDLSAGGTRMLLYMGGYINYRDLAGVHEYQFCRYLQPLTSATDTNLVWHSCLSHSGFVMPTAEGVR